MAEFKLNVNAYSPEYGRSNGGAVMVIGTAVVMTPTPAERHARATVEARETSAALSRAEEA